MSGFTAAYLHVACTLYQMKTVKCIIPTDHILKSSFIFVLELVDQLLNDGRIFT